jgi:hypothetical protein
MQALIVGWQPDGMAVLLRFKFEDHSETDVWVRTQKLPDILLLIQSASERASAIAENAAGGTRTVVVQKVAKLSANHTDEHVPFVAVTLENGLQVHLEMGEKTAAAFVAAVEHLKQNKPAVIRH